MTLNLISLLCKDITELWLQLKKITDEIMQRETSLLYAADIADQLQKKFAFLSGGRGKNGCPVITFPDYPSFPEVPENEFQNVLMYLTSVPHLQDAGIEFILVIDRRQDKWTSVKASLLRIAGSFPGNLQQVLILRPTGIFHRALSDIAFRFNRDDYKMKVPIIMLGSASELQNFIDKTQLTQDLGGTLDYCHDKWISDRTAIEGFAVKVKQTAQMLQTFGTELAETELPNDAESTIVLLKMHTDKKDKLKEDMKLALKQGYDILESIHAPVIKNPEYILNQDQLDNQTTVERLLAQLQETDTAFEEFWVKHHLKLQQCLQLRHFEHKFREIKSSLDSTSEHLASFSDIGNSTSHVEHILMDLCSFEETSQEPVEKARALEHEGNQLIKNNHYAVDCIQPKCNEIKSIYEGFINKMLEKKAHLQRSLELHMSLEKAMKWCDDGIYLLASQPVDKCQSQEGAETALQEMEKFLETGEDWKLDEVTKVVKDYEMILNQGLLEHVQKVFQKQASMQEMFEKRRMSLKKLAAKQTRPVQPVAPRPEAIKSPTGIHRSPPFCSSQEPNNLHRRVIKRTKSDVCDSSGGSVSEDEENLAVLRRHVMNELLETERVYVEELLSVLEGYAVEMENPLMMHLIPLELQNKKDILFGNMEEIYHFHNRIFLKELEHYTDYPELVGRCFLEKRKDLQIYEKYCQNKPRSESLWRQFADCAFFQECQKKLEHKLRLDSYLLKPVQRITKYQLLLKELLKYSKYCEGAEDLEEALRAILGILKAVNDSMHQIAITGYDGNICELGKLLMQGSFSVSTEHKKGHSKVKDFARFKPMQRHLFLYEKAVLFCKKRDENGEGYEKAPSYSYKHSLNMGSVGITETVKGDSKKFEIWYNAREEVYIIQAPTPEVKTAWVNEIRKVLTCQLQACRASQHRSSEQTYTVPLATLSDTSPTKNHQRNLRKMETRSAEGYVNTQSSQKYFEKSRDDAVTSPNSEGTSPSKKRFTLQGFTNLKSQKDSSTSPTKSCTLPASLQSRPASSTSPKSKTKRHEVKSDPTPFGFRGSTMSV
ncbi:guanine nucleotide exchange factor DBS [Protopterus annectens]|uniref:guanine nucleotide exchange factor DBS n=1 Tax=Protopterus annectens TaxID=7888 RepID=UPI001CF93C56|nr:guanine nucleotide exchange factor DBS [Protopterus annectens]